jgi:micrococcal nuclease
MLMLKKFLNNSPLLLIGLLVFLGWKLLGDKNEQWTPDSGKAPPASEAWTVTKVSDGDTITIRQTTGEELKIRFCGIDAPEKQQKLGSEATDYLRSLIDKGDGDVLVTPIEKDRYGRTVAEVFVKPKPGTPGYQSGEEIFLNSEMVMAGFARHYSKYSQNCANRSAITQAEEIAKAKRAGMWSDPNAVAPWDWRKQRR